MIYSTQEELFKILSGAFKVKLRIIKNRYDYIKMVDIWNYLKINKWCKDRNLSISEMTNDIISVDIDKVDMFLKQYLRQEGKS